MEFAAEPAGPQMADVTRLVLHKVYHSGCRGRSHCPVFRHLHILARPPIYDWRMSLLRELTVQIFRFLARAIEAMRQGDQATGQQFVGARSGATALNAQSLVLCKQHGRVRALLALTSTRCPFIDIIYIV